MYEKLIKRSVSDPELKANNVINSFAGSLYTEEILAEEVILYRVYGRDAGELAPYWSRTPPKGPLQAQFDLALRPDFKNSAENVCSIRVPRGTTVYEGIAAPQPILSASETCVIGQLPGGGNQIYIEEVAPAWIIK